MAKILIIEQSIHLLEEMTNALSLEGFKVSGSTTSTQALDIGRVLHPDLIIVDRLIAEEESFQLLSILRNDAATAAASILILTDPPEKSKIKKEDEEILNMIQGKRSMAETKHQVYIDAVRAVWADKIINFEEENYLYNKALQLELNHRECELIEKEIIGFPKELAVGLEKGADAYLLRPTNLSSFATIIYSLLSKRKELHGVEETVRRLLEILEGSLDIVAVTDVKLEKLLYLNQQGRELFHITAPNELTMNNFEQQSIENQIDLFKECFPNWVETLLEKIAIPHAIEHGSWKGETALITYDGKEFPASQLIQTHKNPQSKVEYISTIIRDITDIKKTSEELRKKEQVHRLITENAADLITVLSPKGKILYASPSYFNTLGFIPSEMVGKPLIKFVIEDDQKSAIDSFHATINDIKDRLFECRVISKNGDIKNFEYQGGTIRTDENKAENVILVARDITSRKKTELELRKTNQRFNKLASNVPGVIFQISYSAHLNKRIEFPYMSPACKDFFGFPFSAIHKDADLVLKLIHPEDAEGFFTSMQISAQTMKPWNWEGRFVINNKTVWLTSLARPEEVPDGSILWDGILTDSSARKTAEKERDFMEIQLRHAQKLESIGQLAAGVAHEINTPVQYVGDNIRFVGDYFQDLKDLIAKFMLLHEAAQNGEIKENLLENIEKSIQSADLEFLLEEIPLAIKQSLEGVSSVSRIVQSMKDFSHPGTSKKIMVDLNNIISSTITVSRNEWKYVAELEKDFDLSLPQVNCLPDEFNQAILNLILNACHAIQEKEGENSSKLGKITIKTYSKGSDCFVEITDSGAGIKPEIQDKIFDPFFTTKKVGKGTGQGLAIVHSVIGDKHQGQIDFKTTVGVGTTFIVKIPIDPE